jgi:uncharacterized membrane protein YkoI
MNAKPRLGIALVAAAVLLFAATVQASQSAKHEAEELRRLNLSLIEAIIAAEKEGGGKATSAEFQFKRGNPAFFEVKVLSADGKKLTRYDLDPHTGKVKDTHNELLEKLISRITPDSLRRTPTTLTHAIALAQEQSRGRARSADVDRKDDRLEYDIETVKLDGTLHKMRVSATEGKVIADEAEK